MAPQGNFRDLNRLSGSPRDFQEPLGRAKDSQRPTKNLRVTHRNPQELLRTSGYLKDPPIEFYGSQKGPLRNFQEPLAPREFKGLLGSPKEFQGAQGLFGNFRNHKRVQESLRSLGDFFETLRASERPEVPLNTQNSFGIPLSPYKFINQSL